MRRSPAAEHLAAPPVARQQLWIARNALKVCSTIPASDHVGIATVAPLWSLREATCEASREKKTLLNGASRESAIVPGALLRATEWAYGPVNEFAIPAQSNA